MNIPSTKLLASLITIASLWTAGASAEVPDVEMKLSSTALYVNQELTVTISSKVFCDINLSALGLDDSQFKEYKQTEHAVFNPPKQFKFKFSKPGKYRIFAAHGNMYCGNMKHIAMMSDVLVKPVVLLPPIAMSPPVVIPKPATPAKPKIKHCAKKNGQPVDPACIDD